MKGDPQRADRRRGIVAVADAVWKTFPLNPSLLRLVAPRLRHRASRSNERVALADVSFQVESGELLGLMGANGAGKSTLLRLLLGSLFPSSGAVSTDGRVVMLDLATRMNPELTGRQNIMDAGISIGLSRKELRVRQDAIVDFADLGSAIDDPIRTYSTGMRMRLAFSLFSHTDPDLLIIDEAFSVGDARFVLRCADRLRALRKAGCAILLASHDGNTIAEFCDRALLLEGGRVAFLGESAATVDAYHRSLLPRLSPTNHTSAGESRTEEKEARSTVAEFLEGAVPRKDDPPDSAPVCILAVKLVRGEHGAPSTGVFRHGDECRVEWLIHARRDVENITSGIHIRAERGAYVFGTSYAHLGQTFSVSGDSYHRLGITVSLLLGPGRYVVSVGVAQPNLDARAESGVQLDRFNSATTFEILDFDVPSGTPIPFFGLFRLPAAAVPPSQLDRGSP